MNHDIFRMNLQDIPDTEIQGTEFNSQLLALMDQYHRAINKDSRSALTEELEDMIHEEVIKVPGMKHSSHYGSIKWFRNAMVPFCKNITK